MRDHQFGGTTHTRPRSPHGAPQRQQQPVKGAPSPGTGKVPALSLERLTPTRSGNVRAFATVRVGRGDSSILIDSFKLVKEDDKRAWVAPPAQERQRVDPQTGQPTTKWYPVVTLPAPWLAAIEVQILEAWERYQSTGELPQGTPDAKHRSSDPRGGGRPRC